MTTVQRELPMVTWLAAAVTAMAVLPLALLLIVSASASSGSAADAFAVEDSHNRIGGACGRLCCLGCDAHRIPWKRAAIWHMASAAFASGSRVAVPV